MDIYSYNLPYGKQEEEPTVEEPLEELENHSNAGEHRKRSTKGKKRKKKEKTVVLSPLEQLEIEQRERLAKREAIMQASLWPEPETKIFFGGKLPKQRGRNALLTKHDSERMITRSPALSRTTYSRVSRMTPNIDTTTVASYQVVRNPERKVSSKSAMQQAKLGASMDQLKLDESQYNKTTRRKLTVRNADLKVSERPPD